ncbi:MAG: endonuclease III domain-containing protein [bacterium]|nr:endonuclease III domain-containing protein [bacterium]
MSQSDLLYQIYTRLQEEYGPQSWWPADTPFEVMLGAILTQNTSWTNVEKAMANLREVCELTPEGILSLTPDRLEEAIRSTGYFRQKSARLRSFCQFLMDRYPGDLSCMRECDTGELRAELLSLNGIGPETADSILLYALQGPVFVVDAYTIRLFSRLGLCTEKAKYHEVQSLFMDNIEHDVQMFNEYHALIVLHCKLMCKTKVPLCIECSLRDFCRYGSMGVWE